MLDPFIGRTDSCKPDFRIVAADKERAGSGRESLAGLAECRLT